MILSTEGEVMSEKDDYIPANDDGTEGFVAQSSAMVQLYWEILRNMKEYQKDYEELHKNKIPIGSFTDKWSLHDPIDPKEDNPNPLYFYQENIPFMSTESRGIEKNSYCLTIDLDIRRNKSELIEEIKEIIVREQNKVLGKKRYKNLLGDKYKRTDKEYDNMIYIYKLKGKKPEEIYTKSITDKRGFHSKGSLVHYYRMIDDLINDFPVPIRK
jgi:hypothetical protein